MLQKEAARAFLGEDTPSAGWRTQAVRVGVGAGVGLGWGREWRAHCFAVSFRLFVKEAQNDGGRQSMTKVYPYSKL